MKKYLKFLLLIAALIITPPVYGYEQPFPGTIGLAAGNSHSLAVKSDGTVWAWGNNSRGQLGIGSWDYEDIHSVPVQVKNLTGIIAVAAGESHSLALKEDGTVWAWGSNSSGQLGDGTVLDSPPYCRCNPVQVAGLRNIIAISAGGNHNLALDRDGTVWAWGLNVNGQLGDGTDGPGNIKSIPQKVPNLVDVVQISAGTDHSMALKKDGSVWTWGSNSRGQIGDGSGGLSRHRSSPYQVKGLPEVREIAAGGAVSTILDRDGKVWSWGLVNTESTNKIYFEVKPLQVPLLDDVLSITHGPRTALKRDGTVWNWGLNDWGQLGDGTINEVRAGVRGGGKWPPVRVKGLAGVKLLSAGNTHTLVLKEDGSVWAWGNNWNCQLGLGYKSAREPICRQVIGLYAPAASGSTSEITVMINGRARAFDEFPYIINGTTMVPLRGIFEALGADVRWDGATGTVTATRGDTTVVLKTGSYSAIKNNMQLKLSQPVQQKNGRTMVPLRFISEALGADVQWDGELKTVSISISDR
ncbi:MAG: stalk domain-containing protein [Bacillota bacterium]